MAWHPKTCRLWFTLSLLTTCVGSCAAVLLPTYDPFLSADLQRFWFVLPEHSIQELMSDPEFAAAVRAIKVPLTGNFWDSVEFMRLDKAVGHILSQCQHGVLELGFDFMEPYNFVKHSTGMLFMR